MFIKPISEMNSNKNNKNTDNGLIRGYPTMFNNVSLPSLGAINSNSTSSTTSLTSTSTSPSTYININNNNNDKTTHQHQQKQHILLEKEEEKQEREIISNLPYKQYPKWCDELKTQLKDKTKDNLFDRVKKIEFIVNKIIYSYSLKSVEFKLNNIDKNKMLKCIQNEVDQWKGVEIDSCKIQKKTFKDYQTTARNWFNRNKAKFYGNFFFYPLIFHYVLKVKYFFIIHSMSNCFIKKTTFECVNIITSEHFL